MSDPLPPPPGSQEPVTPENTRKKRDWWNVGVGVLCAVVAVLFVGALIYGAMTDETKEYPGRGASPTAAATGEHDLAAMTQAIVDALETGDEQLLAATVKDIQNKTGCLAVAGGRVTVDPANEAQVREEATKRRQYAASLEEQGLVVGHVEWDTPEGRVHQVIGFQCN